MGLGTTFLEGLLCEHRYRPISGSVVQIGRQTVEVTAPEMANMFRSYGLPLDFLRSQAIVLDRHTTEAVRSGRPLVSDRAFFGALGVTEVHAVDHSDFEGADIIHDMNEPIDGSLEGIADFIVDGSTLDNVHDQATALMNYNRMLRPGGRLISVNAAKANIQGAYTGMPPEWFLDYYAVNDYADCQVLAQLNFPTGPLGYVAADYQWAIERGHAAPLQYEGWAFSFVFAEKGASSTWDRAPTRARFRGAAEQALWVSSLRRFAASKRPRLIASQRQEFSPPPGYIAAR